MYLNAAISADGKLAPANRKFIPFGSKLDQEHLYELRTTADAVMSGARTVDSSAVTMGSGEARFRKRRLALGLPEYFPRVIVSGSGSIDPGAEIFKHRFSPIIVLTSARAKPSQIKVLKGLVDAVEICGDREMDFTSALKYLRATWNIQRLLCEGGGEVNGAMFKAGLVHEVHLTLCPVILGGRQAPTLADGVGFESLAEAARLELVSQRRVGDEYFLVYRVLSPRIKVTGKSRVRGLNQAKSR